MTPDQLDEIEARAEKATPGPWRCDAEDLGRIWGPEPECHYIASSKHAPPGDGHGPVSKPAQEWKPDSEDDWYPNATFIAHAREDVPALIAALEEARVEKNVWYLKFVAEVDGAREAVNSIGKVCDRLSAERDALKAEVERLKAERDHFKREMSGRDVANVLEWTK